MANTTTKTMIMTKSKAVITIFLLTIFLSVNAQESRFKDFAEEHNDRAYCFYTSTIRMLNIGDNPEFNELVNGIEKILVYQLDSISIADKLYNNMLDDFKSVNFEEIVSIAGGGNVTSVLMSPEDVDNQFVGVFINDQFSLVFFMKGDISWQEIPKIMNSFNNDDFINILDINFD